MWLPLFICSFSCSGLEADSAVSSPDSSATSALASLCTLLQGSEQMIAQTLQTLQASQSEPESQDLSSFLGSSFLGSIYEGLHGAHFSTLVFPNRIYLYMDEDALYS